PDGQGLAEKGRAGAGGADAPARHFHGSEQCDSSPFAWPGVSRFGPHRGCGKGVENCGAAAVEGRRKTMSTPYTVVGLGELLWDMFPQGKQLGGAPANFAYMTALLGDRGIVASRVGNDRLGQEAVWQLKSSGLDTSHIQIDSAHPTGTVLLQVDSKGQAEYKFCDEVAWDHLEWSAEWEELAKAADAVCFGSLAQRAANSRSTIRKFLQSVKADAARIFDVN